MKRGKIIVIEDEADILEVIGLDAGSIAATAKSMCG